MQGNIIMLLLGWGIALLSFLAQEQFKNARRRTTLTTGIKLELDEIRQRLVHTVFYTATKMGTLDRKLMDWFTDHLATYQGHLKDPDMLEVLEQSKGMTDQQIKVLATVGAASRIGSLSMKKYSARYLDANLGDLSLLDDQFQNEILESRERLSILAQDVDEAMRYHWMTFDSSLSTENHQVVVQNVDRKYKAIQRWSEQLADQIKQVVVGDE